MFHSIWLDGDFFLAASHERTEMREKNGKSDVQSGCSKVRECVHNVLNKNALQSQVLKTDNDATLCVCVFVSI